MILLFVLGASVPSVPKATTEEEQKAAEIAAKRSRLKQKLVKGARSVAIFSLKLKERRAREAERVAKEKAEELAQEKVRSFVRFDRRRIIFKRRVSRQSINLVVH